MSDTTAQTKQGASLQAFQNLLAQRIADAQNAQQQPNSLLCAVLQGQLLLLPLLDVAEIRSPLPITPISHAHRWVLGLSVARADVMTIIDLGAFLFKPALFANSAARFSNPVGSAAKSQKLIVLHADVSYQVGFLVDDVLGTTTLDTDGYQKADFSSSIKQTNLDSAAPLSAAWRRPDGQLAFEVSLRDFFQGEKYIRQFSSNIN